MADEVLRRAARAINDLRKLATTLNDAGYPGDAIRLQGFAGTLLGLEDKLVDAQTEMDAELLDVATSCRFDRALPQERKRSTRVIASPADGFRQAIAVQ